MTRSLQTTGSGGISLFDAAKKALAEAKTLREVKAIVDKTAALREYARRAKDKSLIENATALKMDAERQIGKMMEEARRTGQMSRGTRGQLRGRDSSGETVRDSPENRPSLRSSGIDTHLAHRARRLASVPDAAYERMRTDAGQSASRRVATHEPGRAIHHPINPSQYSNILMEELVEKIKAMVDGRKMTALASMRGEISSSARDKIEDSITRSIDLLRLLKRRLLTEGAEVITITERRTS